MKSILLMDSQDPLPEKVPEAEKSPSLFGDRLVSGNYLNYTARVTLPLRRQRVHT